MKDELHDLLEAWFDGRLTEEHKQALQLRLRSDREARRVFWEQARIHGTLHVWGQQRVGHLQGRSDALWAALGTAEASGEPAARTQPLARTRFAWIGAGCAFAACAALAVILIGSRTGDIRPDPATEVARITLASGISWATRPAGSDSVVLPTGAYDLGTGTLRFETGAGAVVSIAAPARFHLISTARLELHSGRLTARMLREESVLTVKVDDMEVRDLGTAFGVDATASDRTLVSVFDGSVAVSSEAARGPELRLTEGQSLLDRRGDSLAMEITPYAPHAFTDLWPLAVGIDEASELVEFLPPGPLLKPLREYEANARLFLFPEQQGVTLQRALAVDLSPTAPRWPDSDVSPYPVSAGVRASSYLVFFQPEPAASGGLRHLQGRIVFQRPVLGIICSDQGLDASDDSVAVVSANYETPGQRRGLEEADKEGYRGRGLPHDSIRIDTDGRTIHFDFHVSDEREQMRVLVQAD